MKVSILYFASLREAVGISKEVIDLPSEVATIEHLLDILALRGTHWQSALQLSKGLRCALNQEVVSIETMLVEGAEIAFFPPVTGG
jgi:sulfur-carrier protein